MRHRYTGGWKTEVKRKQRRVRQKAPRILCFVGAGGKTTLIFHMAYEMAGEGACVGITTSTHMLRPEAMDFSAFRKNGEYTGRFVLQGGSRALCWVYEEEGFAGSIRMAGLPSGDAKIRSPFPGESFYGMPGEAARWLSGVSTLLVEADGAKGYPIKVPRKNEPVILKEAGAVIACAGLSCIGQRFSEACFGWAQNPEWSSRGEDLILEDDVADILSLDWGLHKNVGTLPYLCVLNQCDDTERIARGLRIKRILKDIGYSDCVLTCFGRMVREDGK